LSYLQFYKRTPGSFIGPLLISCKAKKTHLHSEQYIISYELCVLMGIRKCAILRLPLKVF